MHHRTIQIYQQPDANNFISLLFLRFFTGQYDSGITRPSSGAQ
jgi:hypothetical protein